MPRISLFFNWQKTGLKRFLAPLPHGMSQNCAWYLNQSNVKFGIYIFNLPAKSQKVSGPS